MFLKEVIVITQGKIDWAHMKRHTYTGTENDT